MQGTFNFSINNRKRKKCNFKHYIMLFQTCLYISEHLLIHFIEYTHVLTQKDYLIDCVFRILKTVSMRSLKSMFDIPDKDVNGS